jgi:hypothetical protein
LGWAAAMQGKKRYGPTTLAAFYLFKTDMFGLEFEK